MKQLSTLLKGVCCVFLLLQFATTNAYGQLSRGDLLFTYFNSKGAAGTDVFAFILLKALPASSVINFTDIGYGGSTFNTDNGGSESRISWSSGATVLPIGTEIKIEGLTATNVRTGTVIGTVTALSGTLGLSLAGLDQVFAYQGALTAASVIAGIHWNNCSGNTSDAAWDVSPCSTIGGVSGSTLPAGLTNANGAMWAGVSSGVARIAGSFGCSGVGTTDVAVLRGLILNRNNWTFVTNTTDPFGAAAGCTYGVLPLKLLSFTGKVAPAGVALHWVTAEEVNTAGFDIERRSNSGDFVTIGRIASNVSHGQYHYVDDRAMAGSTYAYRLKMRDRDGQYTYSPTVSVAYGGKKGDGYRVYPVPVSGVLFVEPVTRDAERNVQFAVIDLVGKTVYRSSLVVSNNGRWEVPVQSLAPGMYVLRVMDKSGGVIQVSPFRKE